MFVFISGCLLVAFGFLLGRSSCKEEECDRADWWKRGEDPPEYGD